MMLIWDYDLRDVLSTVHLQQKEKNASGDSYASSLCKLPKPPGARQGG
jgi:hypothetical protein